MKQLVTVIACIAVFMMTGCAQEPSVEQPAAPDYAGIIAQLEKEQMEYAQARCDLDMNKISQIWAHDDDITIWGPGERERVQGILRRISYEIGNVDVEMRQVELGELKSGMVIQEDIWTNDGILLLSMGQEITKDNLARLYRFSQTVGIKGTDFSILKKVDA